MQFQADILTTPVERPIMKETTALGAAFSRVGHWFWQDLHELRNKSAIEKVFEPKMPSEQAELIYKGWLKAVKRSQNWAED